MSRRILAIEAATDWLSVAMLDDEVVLARTEGDARMQHAAALLPAVESTLSQARCALNDVEAFAVSIGPGSFTSLRIGLATVKGLAFRRDVLAIGVSTLEAMALAGLEGEEGLPAGTEVLALLDARRGDWYAGSFSAGSQARAGAAVRPEERLGEGLYSPSRIAAAVGRELRIVGEPNAGLTEAFAAAEIDVNERVLPAAARPSAKWVGRLGQRLLTLGQGVPAADLAARYLRRAEAEAKRLGGPVEAGEVADIEPSE